MLEGPNLSDADRKYYKYVTRATGRIILETSKLRWSSPPLFNDPFDNQFDLHIDADPQEARRLTLQKLWESYSGAVQAPIGNDAGVAMLLLRRLAGGMSREQFEQIFGPTIDEGIAAGDRSLPRFHREIRDLARKHKILCLSLVPDSPLMWAYYAENHKGFVLRFRSAPDIDSPWIAGQAIRYSSSMPRLLDTESLSDLLSGRSSIANEAALERLVFSKSIDWAHEQEWRVFTGLGREEGEVFEDVNFHPLELDGIIVGCCTPPDDRDAVSAIVGQSYGHAELLQTTLRRREYGLDIVPLDAIGAASNGSD